MTLQPLLAAPPAIVVHVATVVPAFFLGTWVLLASARGSRAHRTLGTAYLVLMTITAVAAIFIRSYSDLSVAVGPLKLGLIHVFVPLTLHGVYGAVTTIAAGDVAGHQRAMISVYFGGLIIAGALAFTPGRLMYRMFLG